MNHYEGLLARQRFLMFEEEQTKQDPKALKAFRSAQPILEDLAEQGKQKIVDRLDYLKALGSNLQQELPDDVG